MNAIEIQHLGLAYQDHKVFADMSLAIPQQQFIALLGANGAGKTTLLRAILGLVQCQAGSIKVLGQPPGVANPFIGYVPQLRSYLGAARITGYDFVASAIRGQQWGLPGLRSAEREAVAVALEKVQGANLARRPVMEMSGGERQRLLLAQALLGSPRLLLLDEPLISLDIHHQTQIIRLVKSLQTDLGITVLFCAHEINPLLEAVDQVLYLGRGNAALGSVDAVIQPDVLSRLYGTPVDVVRQAGRIFVMAGACAADNAEHSHDF